MRSAYAANAKRRNFRISCFVKRGLNHVVTRHNKKRILSATIKPMATAEGRIQQDFGSLAAPAIAPDSFACSSDIAEYLIFSRSTSSSSSKSGNEEQPTSESKIRNLVEVQEAGIREPMRRAILNQSSAPAPRRFYRRTWVGMARRLTKQEIL